MASPTSRPNGIGTNGSPDLPDDIMLDEGKVRELSTPYPISNNSIDYKTLNGNWDVLSPTSSASTTPSIGSPAPSFGSLTKSRSKAMKPRRNQSSYYDEELGVWKCRNCGGTYDMPNPGSRQRREHKKACEETQRAKALQRAQEEEQARRNQSALSENAFEEARNLLSQKISQQQFKKVTDSQQQAKKVAESQQQAKKVADSQQQAKKVADSQQQAKKVTDSQQQAKRVTDDPGMIGAVSSTPDIPEREEVNFRAPEELIHNVELEARKSDAGRRLQETQKADAQSRKSDRIVEGEEPRPGQGAELEEKEHDIIEPSEERDLPSKTNRPAGDHVLGDTDNSSRKTEHSEESKPFNDSNPPSPCEVHPDGRLYSQWSRKTTPSPRTKLLDEFEQVKYCSSTASRESSQTGTLYDELVDLHDEAQARVPRSTSLGRGAMEAARISSLDGALNKNFSRAISLDHLGVEVASKKGYANRISILGGTGAEAGPRKDQSPEDWLELLVGDDHSKSPSLKEGVESPRNPSRVLVKSSGDDRVGQSPTTSPSSAIMKKTQSYTPRGVASGSKQSQAGSPGAGSSRKKQSAREAREKDLGAVIVQNLGQFWKHIAAVGAVALVAWVGKSLADRQEPPRRKIRRGHFAVNSYYWDDQ